GMAAWRYITPGYFRALGIPIRSGRGFAEEDRGAAARSIVVSETLARIWFGAQNAIGRRVKAGEENEWFTIIGVAADVRNSGVQKSASPEFYLVRKAMPDAIFANTDPATGWRDASVVARTSVDPRLAAAALRSTVAGLDPTLPVEIETMRQRLDQLNEQP